MKTASPTTKKTAASLRRYAIIALVTAMATLLTATVALSQSTRYSLPITLEYPLLRHLVVQSAFTEEGESATILDEEDGCARIVISDPNFSTFGDLIRSFSRVKLKLGKAFGNDCFLPIQWEGHLVLLQRPKFLPNSFTLTFETVDSKLYTNEMRPAQISAFVMNQIRKHVHRYLENITLDLSPPVTDLKSFLLPLFPPHNQQIAKEALATLEPGEITVGPNQIKANINIHLPVEPVADETTPETQLTMEEKERFILAWEQWDAFLVHIITQLAGKELTLEDRQTLLETLLITRHRFGGAMESAEQQRDFVRSQFVDTWQHLAPIFRKHLLQPSADDPLGYLSFFTASDAFIAIDTISPALGLDISNNGLIRLARILDDTPLKYRPNMDVTLRQILGLPPEPVDPIELKMEKVPDTPDQNKTQFNGLPLSWWKSLFSPAAWAKSKPSKNNPFSFKHWLMQPKNRDIYLINIRMLLDRAATATHVRKKVARDLYRFYIPFIQATAWQESCYRQFHVKNGAPTYLRSYNGTSVGLMQVHERVWRGIFDVERLRWNVAYNALAGNEIVAIYLERYILKKVDNINALTDKTIAGLIYATYNGGPDQVKKYLARHQKKKYYLSDRLFQQKWDWVQDKQWDRIDRCLGKAKK